MNNPDPTNIPDQPNRLTKSGRRHLLGIPLLLIQYGVLMFGAAGRLNWTRGWIALGLWMFGLGLTFLIAGRSSAGVLNERGRPKPAAKGWDRVMVGIYGLFGLISLLVASLDAGRFGWSRLPLWLAILSGVLVLGGQLLNGWAMSANPYFSTLVYVQKDRGHQAVSTGPYRFVRHPGYAGSSLSSVGIPLMLGSWWGLLPALLAIATLVVRITLEERVLREELPGYTSYTQRIRWRLVPGIW